MKRNPIAKAVKKIRPQIVPNKKKAMDDIYRYCADDCYSNYDHSVDVVTDQPRKDNASSE